ncbi:flagellar export protein FliJ [Bacillaceae bacterium SIJ1]|uniref:flagellar export protein FliJ n=1 Tax=Litoribacterium kuwaitense TaxID=1398745 RepID=UPI0013EBC18A|nr:flagellar export protein FliJ [Litoribacterium kuwaitense]NGP44125.1 flagellar export protein FliJ [Litoribacterium kuwaitense]
MAQKHRFDTIISLKSYETMDARAAYEQSVETFRREGTQLYHMLKDKEQTTAQLEKQLQEGCSLLEIQRLQTHLQTMEKLIDHKQTEVANARTEMGQKQEDLASKSIEQKKYEHLKRNDLRNQELERERQEVKMLDEMAVQHHFKS